ncbi:MAG: hypothetical protein GKR88_11725 [Flavobacteriaceae bacterium]|nr:MAG: hypothetical protein GKR88_11725 [Flavobacteriaceae bacterium]
MRNKFTIAITFFTLFLFLSCKVCKIKLNNKQEAGTSANFSGSYMLQENDRYQILYASQNYGTFYSVYSKFFFKNDYLEKIEFKIINYKGLVNIGFLDCKNGCIRSDLTKNGTLKIDLPVKGMAQKSTILYKPNAKIHIDSLQNIFVQRHLVKLNTKGERTNKGVFDTEYYYRSGNFTDSRKIRPGMVADSIKRDSITLFAISNNCHSSILKAYKNNN